MKKLILLFVLTFAGSANAGVITNFTAGYDVSNWTQDLNGGVIDLSGAPLSILEISNNSGSGGSANTDFTIAALGDGLVTFDWLYQTNDVDGSFFDPFGYLINGLFTQLTVDELFTAQSGTTSFSVITGDIFGFRQNAVDSALGSGFTTVSGFSAPAVPEPVTLVLMGLGLVGLGFSRRNRR